jgi:hypothetical protein
MSVNDISLSLQDMLDRSPDVRACALVEAASGLVWTRCGAHVGNEPLWEAASEYWRLHGRIEAHFAEQMGPLGAAVLYHHRGLLVILPCARDPDLLLVCVASPQAVDWRTWRQQALALGDRIKNDL